MCNRYANILSSIVLRDLFRALGEGAPPSPAIAPTDRASVVRRHPGTGERHIDPLRWGLVPAWASDLSVGTRAFNARAETLAEKPTFRDAYARRRALIPFTAFYERQRDSVRDGRPVRRIYEFTPADAGALAFAGLWEGWRDPATGEWVRTFTIITTAPNSLMAPIHDRMPVVLEPADWGPWLGEGGADQGMLAAMLRPCSADVLRCRPVSETDTAQGRRAGQASLGL